MAYDALTAFSDRDLSFRFVSNVDGTDLYESLRGLDPEETLFIVSSKTFTTLETLTNARSARDWLLAGNAATTRRWRSTSWRCRPTPSRSPSSASTPTNMFEFWDWVGGRYSYDSAIGLSLDDRDRPRAVPRDARRLPRDRRALPHHAVRAQPARAPRPHRRLVHRLLRRRDAGGPPVQRSTSTASPPTCSSSTWRATASRSRSTATRSPCRPGPIVWGQPGTNGQHAFYQLIHQGTRLIPCDFIGFVPRRARGRRPPGPADGELLRADRGARVRQDEGRGRGGGRARVPGAAPHLPRQPPDELDPRRAAHAVRRSGSSSPCTSTRCSPRARSGTSTRSTSGASSWARRSRRTIVPELESETVPALAHDSSTSSLIRRYRKLRGRAV